MVLNLSFNILCLSKLFRSGMSIQWQLPEEQYFLCCNFCIIWVCHLNPFYSILTRVSLNSLSFFSWGQVTATFESKNCVSLEFLINWFLLQILLPRKVVFYREGGGRQKNTSDSTSKIIVSLSLRELWVEWICIHQFPWTLLSFS